VFDTLPRPVGASRGGGLQPGRVVLPAWPIYLLFVGFPLFWLLGLGEFTAAICAVPMAALLWARRRVAVPIGLAFWVLFVLWVGIAVLQIDDGLRLVGYGVRLSNYLGATVVFVYAYNLRSAQLSIQKGLWALVAFFAFVVFGGWLGVLLPGHHLTTLVSILLPANLTNNAYVSALVRPAFAEVQHPFGAPAAFSRPSAPFAYTNGWGCNVALLLPCMAAAAVRLGQWGRTVVVVTVGLALVPAVATLNRGMFLAIGVGLAYAAIRLALRGRIAPLVGLLVTAALGVGFALASGVAGALQERLRYSQSNTSRTTIYGEAFRGALNSPLLGNGAPRPSQTLNISVGTQGQIWNVMFSFGFLALFFFLGWFAWVALVSSRWNDVGDLWLHVCLVVAFVTIAYYGYDGPQLTVVMFVAALALRRVRPLPP
jgi:hypothetical protein